MNNKLTIFWIEDNPIQSNVERKNGKQYPKFLHEEFISYYLFQHPKQVEEYLSMINVIKNTTPAWAEKCQNALPDIVVFDYKMADAFKNNQHALSYYDNDHNIYLQAKSVSRKIKDTFENQFKNQILFLDRNDVKEFEYGGDEFKKEIKASDIQLDDEFGLYCGIAIVREFKEYITVGVPATINKADKAGTMSYNSLFYEWINSYDLKGAIDRPANADEMKDWSKILNFSSNLLRKRIETQLQSNKITLNLAQLLAWTNQNPSDEEKEIITKRIFTFQTEYGVRHLPLDGLFIDEPTDKRDEAIKTWIGTLLSTFQTKEYLSAKKVSKTLIDAYKGLMVEHRLRLSELAIKLCNGETLLQKEEDDLNNVKSEFDITDSDIEKIKKRDIKNINISSSKIFDFRDLTKDKSALEKRLVVLFTELRMYTAWQEFKKKNENSTYNQDILSLLSSGPTFVELRAALYPVAKNPLILDYHREQLNDKSILNKNLFESWEKPIGEHLNKDAIYSKKEYPIGLTEGEKVLSRSFALEIGLEGDNFPEWLNTKLL